MNEGGGVPGAANPERLGGGAKSGRRGTPSLLMLDGGVGGGGVAGRTNSLRMIDAGGVPGDGGGVAGRVESTRGGVPGGGGGGATRGAIEGVGDTVRGVVGGGVGAGRGGAGGVIARGAGGVGAVRGGVDEGPEGGAVRGADEGGGPFFSWARRFFSSSLGAGWAWALWNMVSVRPLASKWAAVAARPARRPEARPRR